MCSNTKIDNENTVAALAISKNRNCNSARHLTREKILAVKTDLIENAAASKIICTRISKESFLEFISDPDNYDLEQDVRMKFVATDVLDCKIDSDTYGKVWLIELTESRVHKVTKLKFMSQIIAQHNLEPHLMAETELRCDFAGIISKRSDNAIFPRRGGNLWPTIVLEVAYKNESYETLQSELLEWISSCTEVELAVGIKIDDHRSLPLGQSYAGHVRMRVLLYRRNQIRNNIHMYPTKNGLNAWYDPESVIEFGTDIPQHGLTLCFPIACLFAAMQNPPALAIQNLIANNTDAIIDLDDIRDVIMELI
jgi:hypothetical protein